MSGERYWMVWIYQICLSPNLILPRRFTLWDSCNEVHEFRTRRVKKSYVVYDEQNGVRKFDEFDSSLVLRIFKRISPFGCRTCGSRKSVLSRSASKNQYRCLKKKRSVFECKRNDWLHDLIASWVRGHTVAQYQQKEVQQTFSLDTNNLQINSVYKHFLSHTTSNQVLPQRSTTKNTRKTWHTVTSGSNSRLANLIFGGYSKQTVVILHNTPKRWQVESVALADSYLQVWEKRRTSENLAERQTDWFRPLKSGVFQKRWLFCNQVCLIGA